jgi:ferritin-like metal-binding protein YciE
MKKLYFLNEEEKNRILNLHESATKRQYLNEQKDIEQKMKELGAKISVDLSTRLVKAGLNSVRQKVVGVIFCSVKNGVITADNEYKGKKWDDFVKDFTITNQDIETAKKACPKKNNSQQYKQQIITKTSDTTKQIQALLKLDPTGVMDSGLLQKINDKLNGKPQEAPKSDANAQPRPKVEPVQQLTQAGVNTQQITTLNPEQLTAGLQQMQQKVAASTAGLTR